MATKFNIGDIVTLKEDVTVEQNTHAERLKNRALTIAQYYNMIENPPTYSVTAYGDDKPHLYVVSEDQIE